MTKYESVVDLANDITITELRHLMHIFKQRICVYYEPTNELLDIDSIGQNGAFIQVNVIDQEGIQNEY